MATIGQFFPARSSPNVPLPLNLPARDCQRDPPGRNKSRRGQRAAKGPMKRPDFCRCAIDSASAERVD
jgi:hypothetical protein